MLHDSQYGFRTSRGTNDAVFKLVNDIYRSKDSREFMVACFLDVRKAFDCIHHSELIQRMRDLNLPAIYCDWLCAYLGDRTQRVMCNVMCTVSTTVSVQYGVPQGSILGPLLFICYVNKLPDEITNCSTVMYADDVVFYTSDTLLHKATTRLQTDATNVYNWFCRSGLCINTDKTKVIGNF